MIGTFSWMRRALAPAASIYIVSCKGDLVGFLARSKQLDALVRGLPGVAYPPLARRQSAFHAS